MKSLKSLLKSSIYYIDLMEHSTLALKGKIKYLESGSCNMYESKLYEQFVPCML